MSRPIVITAERWKLSNGIYFKVSCPGCGCIKNLSGHENEVALADVLNALTPKTLLYQGWVNRDRSSSLSLRRGVADWLNDEFFGRDYNEVYQ